MHDFVEDKLLDLFGEQADICHKEDAMERNEMKKDLPVDHDNLDDDVDLLQHSSLAQGPVKFLEALQDKYVVLNDFSLE